MVRKAKKRVAKRPASKSGNPRSKAVRAAPRPAALRRHNPASIAPGTNYSHGVEAPAGARLLGIAGQVGRDAHGRIPDGIEAQATLAWANIKAVLAEAGMEMSDIVHYFSILVRREDNAGYDKARVAALGDVRPASTKIYISGLAQPELLCEVQAFAARVDRPKRRAR
jgi:enamine deaminase RidA (YjgF/YER057c/UK114 family)